MQDLGNNITILCNAGPIRNNSGTIIGGVATWRDITEHKKMDKVLRESQASLANAQRIAHIGNYEWDIIKNESRCSDEVYRIFGLAPQSCNISYEVCMGFVHPDDRDFVKKSIKEALHENKPYNVGYRILLSDSSVRIVHAQAEVVFDTTGRAVQLNGTIQDITENKRIEEELKQLNESLEQRLAEQTAILSKVREELRAEIIKREQIEKVFQGSYDTMIRQLEGLQKRLEELQKKENKI